MKKLLAIAIALALSLSIVAPASASGASKVRSAIWADGQIYGTVLTPNDLPQRGNFDNLLNFDGSGLSGQRSVSDSKPGDRDFNGGRWAVYAVTFTDLGRAIHDPDGDGVVNFELTSYEQVLMHESLGHLTIGDNVVRYFVCPVIPER
jgi:hypothetical protein